MKSVPVPFKTSKPNNFLMFRKTTQDNIKISGENESQNRLKMMEQRIMLQTDNVSCQSFSQP